ncbi:MAG TPA: P-loop NTPase [Gemmatimonadales bacterium]|jgi:ATP-binding protein involved in chromosome partitioning
MRTYHELTNPDRSGLLDQILTQRRRVADRLAGVRRTIAVMSGKGGVGKSYVTAHLARALARAGQQVGILDADLNGPTIPRLLETPRAAHRTSDDGVEPAIGLDGVKCISMALLLEDGAPLAFKGPSAESFVWRGAMEASALREFLGDVNWGSLDTLLLDLPPGMQRYIELCDILGKPPAVLTVTIPTPESRDAVRRAMRAAVEHGSDIVGIVENMVGREFTGTAADDLAKEFDRPVVARIPWHPTPDTWSALAAGL